MRTGYSYEGVEKREKETAKGTQERKKGRREEKAKEKKEKAKEKKEKQMAQAPIFVVRPYQLLRQHSWKTQRPTAHHFRCHSTQSTVPSSRLPFYAVMFFCLLG